MAQESEGQKTSGAGTHKKRWYSCSVQGSNWFISYALPTRKLGKGFTLEDVNISENGVRHIQTLQYVFFFAGASDGLLEGSCGLN